MHTLTKMADATKLRQNRQIRQDDFALKNFTKILQNRQLLVHVLVKVIFSFFSIGYI